MLLPSATCQGIHQSDPDLNSHEVGVWKRLQKSLSTVAPTTNAWQRSREPQSASFKDAGAISYESFSTCRTFLSRAQGDKATVLLIYSGMQVSLRSSHRGKPSYRECTDSNPCSWEPPAQNLGHFHKEARPGPRSKPGANATAMFCLENTINTGKHTNTPGNTKHYMELVTI